MEVLSNEALARLHPTVHHPESAQRLEVLLEAAGKIAQAPRLGE